MPNSVPNPVFDPVANADALASDTSDLALLAVKIDGGWRRLSRVLFFAWFCCCLTGCSLFIMANKVFFGDPVVPSDFESITRTSLEDSDETILVLCTAPHSIRSEIGSLELDVIYGVTRILKRREINVVDPEKVGTWLDDNGGVVNTEDLHVLGTDLDADYIAHVEIANFSHRKENSPDLFQGHAVGEVHVYKIREYDGEPVAEQVFTRPFDSKYPQNYPMTSEQVSANAFLRTYTDRITAELARNFHSYRVSETVE